MRLIIAALLGGSVMFFWGFVSHMLLPIGELGMKQATSEDTVLVAVRDSLPGEGVYLIPGLGSEKYDDPAAVAAYSEKAKASPYAFVVYQPQGQDGMDMGDELGREWATNALSAWLVAWVLSLGAFGFGRRVLLSSALGLFAWLAISVPYWNWYRFPLDFTLGSGITQVLGWTMAGAAMAWWLGRKGG